MLSIVICTYNRATSLSQTLADLSQVVPAKGYQTEVLVIDNNSTDETATLVSGVGRCGPYDLRYIREEKQGLSHARNRGIREARGEWIIFTDDDVRIEPGWLCALAQHMVQENLAIGGRVCPIWPACLPRWIATDGPYLQRGVFLHYDLGEVSRSLQPDEREPFGCNMAFRADVFPRAGLFRTDLGRTGRRLLAGEDGEMFSRLRKLGVPVIYAADATVHHPVETQRLSLAYLIRWKFWAGYSADRETREAGGRRFLGVLCYRYRHLLSSAGKGAFAVMRRDLPAFAHHMGVVCAQSGFIFGVWREGAKNLDQHQDSLANCPSEVDRSQTTTAT